MIMYHFLLRTSWTWLDSRDARQQQRRFPRPAAGARRLERAEEALRR